MSLTPKQKEILDYILGYQAENGYSPTQQEIARHFGFSSLGTVQNYLKRLEANGALEKEWNARRSMKVVPTGVVTSAISLPVAGRVAAGRPIESSNIGETLDVPASLLKSGEHFVLKVKGDSMIGDGILEDDFVIVRKQTQFNNGQTVVALIDNEASVKRLQQKRGRIELHSSNPKYDPIVIEEATSRPFKIEGVVVGIIRKMEGA